jgi:predicted phage terminase large subunit-like protein
VRDLSHDELYDKMVQFRDLAKKSTPMPWEQFLKTDFCQEVRRRSKSDLFFLAKYLIGYDNQKNELLLERVHRRVCDLFVQKMDDKSIAEQDERKERMLLYPRGCFKSTLNGIDAVQWVLNFPNIRILFMTADKDLSETFLKEFKSRFTIKESASFMNIFFPDFCVEDAKLALGNVSSFTTPARTNKDISEPTVTASSIDSTLSGHHYDVLKSDDVISNRNSGSDDLLLKLYKNFYINKKTLMPYGYLDIIGTRYHTLDLYGKILENNVGEIVHLKDEESGLLPSWEYIENKDSGLQIVIGRAIVPRVGVLKDIKELLEEEAILLFPEYLTFKKLRKEWHENEPASEGQYNQNPRPKSTTTFDLPLLHRQTIDHTKIPYSGPITITWDFAFSKKKGRDYSTGCVVRWNDKGQAFIIDLVRDKFSPTDLAKAVVDLAKDWRPQIIGIEKSMGADFLEAEIVRQAQNTGIPEVMSVCGRIDWYKPDNQKDAKAIRMGALHPWLVDNRMFFANFLPYLDVLYNEFQDCMVSHHHDDIPDVISQQPRYAPRITQLIQTKELSSYSVEDASFNLLFIPGSDCFGNIGFANPQSLPIVPVPVESGPEAESMYEDAPSILGAGLRG